MQAVWTRAPGGPLVLCPVTRWQEEGEYGDFLVFTDTRGSSLPTDSTASLAYCLAPVSVLGWRRALPDGSTYDGFTVVAYDEGRLDFPALRSRLNDLEPGWTPPQVPGRTCSSPMNRSTALTVEQVLAEVAKHML